MPLWFLYHRSKTLAKRGTKTIHVLKTSSNTKRATAALTVLAAGEWLKPMIIFKGQPRGRIAWKELKTFNPLAFYACQKADDINSKDGDGGELDSDNKEEEFFPVFEEEEGATVTMME